LRVLPSAANRRPGELIPDHFAGKIAAIYVGGAGLVVISWCEHVGIINTVRLAQQVTEVERVYAVVGGWHLADATEDVIGRTACALMDLGPDYFIPMRSTGFSTMARLERALPGRAPSRRSVPV